MQQLLADLSTLTDRWQEHREAIDASRVEAIRGECLYYHANDMVLKGRGDALIDCVNELAVIIAAHQAKIAVLANLVEQWRESGKRTTSDDPTYDNTRESVLQGCADALEEVLK